MVNHSLISVPISLCLQVFLAFREDNDVVGWMQGFGHLNDYCSLQAPLAQSFMKHSLLVKLSMNEFINLLGLVVRRLTEPKSLTFRSDSFFFLFVHFLV